MLNHSNDEMNYLAATLNGIVLCYGPGDIIGCKLQDLSNILKSKPSDHILLLTALWTIASFAERKGFERIGGVPAFIVENIGLYNEARLAESLMYALYHIFCMILVELLTHNANTVVTAACHCLGQIGRRNDLPFPNRNLKDPVKYGDFDGLQQSETDNENKMMDIDKTPCNEKDEQTSLTQLRIVEKLLDLAVGKNTLHKVRLVYFIIRSKIFTRNNSSLIFSSQVKVKATEALGLLCVGVEDFPYRKLIIHTIIDKENEVKFLS